MKQLPTYFKQVSTIHYLDALLSSISTRCWIIHGLLWGHINSQSFSSVHFGVLNRTYQYLLSQKQGLDGNDHLLLVIYCRMDRILPCIYDCRKEDHNWSALRSIWELYCIRNLRNLFLPQARHISKQRKFQVIAQVPSFKFLFSEVQELMKMITIHLLVLHISLQLLARCFAN